MADIPVTFEWNGAAMMPLPRFREICSRQFKMGEHYRLEEREERSQASHNHYYAMLDEAWENLPEDLMEKYPTREHLRHKALIAVHYADLEESVWDTEKDAAKHAYFSEKPEGYAVVSVSGKVVRIWHAKSQARGAMDKATFQDSKNKVIAYVSGLLGISSDDLSRNAGRAA